MLTRERVVWWPCAIKTVRGVAEPKPRWSTHSRCRRSACGRRGLCPCALIGPAKAALSHTDGSAAPLARAFPPVRSADTAEPFSGGQPVKPGGPVVIPCRSPWGRQAPPFSLLCLLGLLAHGCHPMLAIRLGAGFRPGLYCQIAPRSRPLIPTTARDCCCRPDASPGEDHETSSVMP